MTSKDLTSRIVNQHRQQQSNENLNQIKNKVKLMKFQHHQEQLNELRLKFSDQQKRLKELNQEQGALTRLTTLPILDEGYDLTKQLFWDLIRIRYGWILTNYQLIVSVDQNSTPNMLSRARKVVLFHFSIITLETSRQNC